MLNKKQLKEANSYLLFRAMAEIMLDLYGNLKPLKRFWDSTTLLKWKNLIPSLERGSKEIYKQLNEDEIKIFYHFANALEYLVKCTEDPHKFYELTSLIISHQKGDITIINTREELIQAVEAGKKGFNG